MRTSTTRLGLIHTRLDLIHTGLDTIHTRLDLIHTRPDLIHTRLDLVHTRLDLIHTRLDLIHTRLDLIHTRLDLIHVRSSQVVWSVWKAKVTKVLGSTWESSETVESEGRQMKQCWITYIKRKKSFKKPLWRLKKEFKWAVEKNGWLRATEKRYKKTMKRRHVL